MSSTPPSHDVPLEDPATPPEPGLKEHTSDIIRRLAENYEGHDITVETIIDALKDRSFGVLMILFALPNAVIPGISWILGAPIVILGLQIALGREEPWLPQFMQKRTIPADLFQQIAGRSVKFLVWIEKLSKPRWSPLVSGWAERVLGVFIAFAAVVLMAPIPFGNALPAFGISFISVGLIEKDGRAVAIGMLLALLGAVFIGSVFLIGFEAVRRGIGLL